MEVCKNNTDVKISLDKLPEEILERMLWYLSPYRECDDAARVCKVWQRLIHGIQQQRHQAFRNSTRDGQLRWSHKQCPRSPITSRHSHSACYVDGNMYIFGGSSVSETTFNDIWKLDLTSRKWMRVIASGSGPRSMPSPRSAASMVYYKGALIVFGGWAPPLPSPLFPAPRFYNELHVYNMALNKWSAVTTAVTPPPMAGHRATVINNKMIIFGGSHEHERSNDIWVLNMDTVEWYRIDTERPKPMERSRHGQIKIDDTHQLIIGGWGKNGMLCNDIWLLHMEHFAPWHWTQIQIENPAQSPPDIWCHPVVKVGDTVVVYSKGKTPQHGHHNPSISSMRSGPRRPNELRPAHSAPKNVDKCVNGIRGILVKNAGTAKMTRGSKELYMPSRTMPNFNLKENGKLDYPGLKCNCSCKWTTKSKASSLVHASSPLQLYVLDISRVVQDHVVKWNISVQSEQPMDDTRRTFPIDHRPPSERMSFYSVVLGQAEVIMFGGAVMDPEMGKQTTAMSNTHFAC